MSHMRQDVFSRKFTRELGLSPKAFVSRALVRKASLLLGGPGMTVKEAAGRLNFSSEYYFSRFFKQHTGLSPREFQRGNGVLTRDAP
jgi:AraC-like DNA-binding protein